METLQVLSRQHIEDKLKCRELMKDIQQKKDRQTLKQSIIQFWKNSVQKHVESEEIFLFPFLQKHQFSRDFINTLKREHDTIRTLAERLPFYEDGYQLYKAFIKLVEQHSQFEDEILFRKMKEELPPQELAQLNMAMAR
jgi:hemerythrin-like domain-containing protein